MDATGAWTYHVTKDKRDMLAGLPDHTIDMAREKAKSEKKEGWIITLDEPCYWAVMSYGSKRTLREKVYRAYITRASKEAEAKQFDNSDIIDEILKLRQEKVSIIGYNNYAELSLSPKMAKSTSEVMTFAEQQDNITDFSSWDTNYYATLYKKLIYNFSDEDLRPYFPEKKVFEGLSKLVSRLYGIKIEEIRDFSKWNESVRLFEIKDKEGNLRGKFYADLFARDFKQSGA